MCNYCCFQFVWHGHPTGLQPSGLSNLKLLNCQQQLLVALLVGFYLLAACFALRSHANSTTSRITVLAIWMRVMLVTGVHLLGA